MTHRANSANFSNTEKSISLSSLPLELQRGLASIFIVNKKQGLQSATLITNVDFISPAPVDLSLLHREILL